MQEKKNKEKGSVTLEACITLPLFIFVILLFYSFFVVYETRNEMAHLVLATTNSLSLDTYSSDGLGESTNMTNFFYDLYESSCEDNSHFVNLSSWHKNASETTEGGETKLSGSLEAIIEERFLAYLTDGEMDQAEALLKRYHVVGGKSGLDFSGSKLDGDNIYISVKYTIALEFNFMGMGTLAMEQTACSKLWK